MVFVASAGAGLGAAALIGGASLGAGVLGYLGTTQAANAQVGAETQALNFQKQQAQNNQPFINAGTGAVNQAAGLFGIGPQGNVAPDYSPFYSSPDYQFALQQGQLGLQRYENANGLALSGGGVKDALAFNQGLATQTYGNYFNRLMGLSQLGSNAAANNNQAAASIAGTQGAIGASQASGIIGGTNALTSGINSGIQNSLLYNAINRSSYAGWGTPASPFPSTGDLGLGGMGTGGYNFLDAAAGR